MPVKVRVKQAKGNSGGQCRAEQCHGSEDTDSFWYFPTSSSILGISSGMRKGLEMTSS